MDKFSMLARLKELYDQNENMMQYLKNMERRKLNSVEDIMISYDFQAGTYVSEYEKNPGLAEKSVERLADYVTEKGIRGRVLEAGVGEATSLAPLLGRVKSNFSSVYGFDISWSRIKTAQKFLAGQGLSASLFVGDLFCIPLKDDSMDLVYTCHAIEPNGGRERAALKELYRVAKRYLILQEPAYELADEHARQRMRTHGYVTKLYQTALDLGYHVTEYGLRGVHANALNPTGFMVIEKKAARQAAGGPDESVWRCPWTNTDLKRVRDAYFSSQSLLAYPIIGGVPCLTKQNAVVAAKFLEF